MILFKLANILFFQSLILGAKSGQWKSLSKREAADFQENDSDLLDKWNINDLTKIQIIELAIPKEHAEKLKSSDDEIVELYNAFDIWLKHKFNLKVVDFINYDDGKVFLIKPSETIL